MRNPVQGILSGTLVACVFMVLAGGQASAATMGQPSNTAFQAIYGNPGSNGATLPVGGGLGRNFGFGETMLFRANTTAEIGKNIHIKLGGAVTEVRDADIGATLTSDKTGENNPLGLDIQFVDLQDGTVGGTAWLWNADTVDRPWITEICAPGAEACHVDPRFTVGTTKTDVKIEDVSLEVGGIPLQGTVWGEWINGTAKKAPCIKLVSPPADATASQTLIATQPAADVGASIEEIGGEACLISANDDWYRVSSYVVNEPAITIKNE
jgi:hypothetical protein